MPDDFQLVQDFLEGKKSAFATIEGYIDDVLNGWRTRFGYQTDDIKSDIIEELRNIFEQGRFNFKSSLKYYVKRVAKNSCIDFRRYLSRIKTEDIETIPLPDSRFNPESQMEKKELLYMIFRVMRQAPRECRKIWILMLKETYNYKEIGARLGKTEDYIKWLVWKCRKTARELRKKFEKISNL